jgi:putative glycosyltransferase (TIGR04372 family)
VAKNRRYSYEILVKSLFKLGRLSDVVDAYESSSLEAPNLDIRSMFVRSLFGLGRYSEVIKQLLPRLRNENAAQDKNGLDDDGTLSKSDRDMVAKSLFELGRYADAVSFVEMAPFEHRTQSQRQTLVKSLFSLMRYGDVVVVLQDIFTGELIGPEYEILVKSLFELGRLSDVVDAYESSSLEAPNLDIRSMFVRSLFGLGRYSEVIKQLSPRLRNENAAQDKNGLDDDGTLSKSDRDMVAKSLFELGRYADAVTFVEMAPFEHRTQSQRQTLVESLFNLMRYADVVLVLQDIPTEELIGPEYEILVKSLFELGRLSDVVDAYESSSLEAPNLDLRSMFISSLFGLGRYSEVVNRLSPRLRNENAAQDKNGLDDDGTLSKSDRDMVAKSLFELGRYADAVSFVEIGNAIEPETLSILVKSLFALGRYDQVVDLLDRSSTSELEPDTVIIFAKSLYKVGKHEDVLRYLKSSSKEKDLDTETLRIQALALVSIQRYAEAVALFEIIPVDQLTESERLRYLEAMFELEQFDKMVIIAETLTGYEGNVTRAHVKLLAGNEQRAAELLTDAAAVNKYLRRPHQNIASRDPPDYTPTEIDFLPGTDGLLYDQLNYLGQRVIHVGAGHLSVMLYSGALEAQKRLRSRLPRPSISLVNRLESLGIEFSDLRILGPEWTTQIGHLGMADLLLRMRDIGWWTGVPLMLARKESVANPAFLSLFESFHPVLIAGGNVSEEVWNELFSFQRYLGLPFNAWEMLNGEVLSWNEAGALLLEQWERAAKGNPLREEFDRRYGAAEMLIQRYVSIRDRWGMRPNDWHVCLHLREETFHKDKRQQHRNADMASYLDAIRYITDRGGWVIRIGASGATVSPQLFHFVDYGCDSERSPLMDLQLMRTAKYFIGTISGLTNAAISLGLPCALVNCITYDAQMWNSSVRFTPKIVTTGEGKKLTARDLTTAPWRWKMFDAEVVRRYKIRISDSSPDEILETVKEVDALANGRRVDEDQQILEWRQSLGFSHFYGSGRPSCYFLDKHRN